MAEMSNQARAALDAIRAELHRQVAALSRDDYREVIEELAADMEGYLGCIEDESRDESST